MRLQVREARTGRVFNLGPGARQAFAEAPDAVAATVRELLDRGWLPWIIHTPAGPVPIRLELMR